MNAVHLFRTAIHLATPIIAVSGDARQSTPKARSIQSASSSQIMSD